MSRITKNKKAVQDKYDINKYYTVEEACKLVKEITTTKFDASVDLDIRLGVDPKKADQMVRGTSSLPHGTGKALKVLAICSADKEDEAKKAYDDERATLSGLYVSNAIMPVIYKFFKNNDDRVNSKIIQAFVAYASSRTPKSGKFVIAK